VRSGKTNLFVDFAKCVELNFHGFQQLHNIEIETDRVNRRLLQKLLPNLPDATESVTDIRFNLNVSLPDRAAILQPGGPLKTQFTIHVRDAPGEAAFPGPEMGERQIRTPSKMKELDEWFSKAKGIVLVISALNAGTDAGLRGTD
jgi:hypothetical protein